MIAVLIESLRGAVMVSGLVVVMMMLIEVFNVKSEGRSFSRLRQHRFGQVLLASALGSIPGCMGGFLTVSLYSHGLLSFGALTAMMVASSGDEAFMMLAMFPDRAWWIFLLLFIVAVICGLTVDLFKHQEHSCNSLAVHDEDHVQAEPHTHSARHFSWQRVLMFIGVLAFMAALVMGLLEEEADATAVSGLNLLSEDWMHWLFAIVSLVLLAVLLFASDHFVEEHLWEHIVCHHLPGIFLWTFGVMLGIGILMQYVQISDWISDNTALMILLAALIGFIPESGPHLVFVTLFASGIVPLPVLLASCISQDGHASLPLLSEDKRAFLKAKLINFLLALIAGFAALWIMSLSAC